MDYKKKLITLRQERKLTKSALYGGICSKGKYLALEDPSNNTSVTITEMTAILDRLGMSWPEFVEYTDLSTKKNTNYGRLKLELLDIAQNLNDTESFQKNLTAFVSKIENQKFESSQLFSTYIAAIHLSMALSVPITYDQTELYDCCYELFQNRNEYYAVDYEIIGNLSILLDTDRVINLAKYLFPSQLNRGYHHDDVVQIAAINIIEVLIKQKKYELAEEWIRLIKTLIDTPGFIRNPLTTLKLLYLKEEVAFRKTKNVKHYSELLRYADIFKDMGETVIHKAILKDTLHQISKEYDIEIPHDHLLYQQHYAEQLDQLEDKVDY